MTPLTDDINAIGARMAVLDRAERAATYHAIAGALLPLYERLAARYSQVDPGFAARLIASTKQRDKAELFLLLEQFDQAIPEPAASSLLSIGAEACLLMAWAAADTVMGRDPDPTGVEYALHPLQTYLSDRDLGVLGTGDRPDHLQWEQNLTSDPLIRAALDYVTRIIEVAAEATDPFEATSGVPGESSLIPPP